MNPQDGLLKNPKSEGGKLHPDSEAQAAINSMTAGELADKLTHYEALYEAFMYKAVGQMTLKGRLAWLFADTPLRIFRKEIGELARSHQALIAGAKALESQASFGQEYLRLREDLRLLRVFLVNNFAAQLEKAVEQEKPIFELVKELLASKKG
jgi:hypothetical protein